jgi:hypothetical protein
MSNAPSCEGGALSCSECQESPSHTHKHTDTDTHRHTEGKRDTEREGGRGKKEWFGKCKNSRKLCRGDCFLPNGQGQ